jgi:ABC-type transport system substrate-binding protein
VSDFVFNIAKGRLAYYASLPAANDALIAIPIEAAGVESDATLKDYDTVAALLAAANNEQTTMGRKTLASVTTTVDDTNDRNNMDATDITWTAATGNAISDILICYDPDTTGGTDADLIPLTWHDYPATPDGSDITATVTDFARAS